MVSQPIASGPVAKQHNLVDAYKKGSVSPHGGREVKMKRKPVSPYPRISQLSPTPHPKGYLGALHAQDQVLMTWTFENI